MAVAHRSNLTIQLDDQTIREAKVLAAEEGTSVSALVAREIRKLTAAKTRYKRAKDSALRMLDEAADRGGASWTREEIYQRHQR